MKPINNKQHHPEAEIRGAHPAIASPSRRQYLLYGFFFKVRGLLAAVPLFAIFFTTRGEWGSALLAWVIGLPLFTGAFLLRIRSQQYLRYRLREDSALTTAGPYAYVRNPVYIANITGLAALCILCRLYWVAPIAAAWAAVVYHLAVRFEEMRLLKRDAEQYRQYLERVPRWIPSLAIKENAGGGYTGFWIAARVEWQSLLLLLIPLAKDWGLRPRAGQAHEAFGQAMSFIAVHKYSFAVALAAGFGVLAALNVQHLRSNRRKKTEAPGDDVDETRPPLP